MNKWNGAFFFTYMGIVSELPSHKGQAFEPFIRVKIAISEEAIAIVKRAAPSRLANVVVEKNHNALGTEPINHGVEGLCHGHVQYVRVVLLHSALDVGDVEAIEDVAHLDQGEAGEHVSRPGQPHTVELAAADLGRQVLQRPLVKPLRHHGLCVGHQIDAAQLHPLACSSVYDPSFSCGEG